MDALKAPHLKQFFAFRFAVLMLATAIISVGLTTGGLYFFYLSSLEEKTKIASGQFMSEFGNAEDDLKSAVQDMARLVSPEAENTAYPSLPDRGHIRLLGIGDKRFWSERFGFAPQIVDSAFDCLSCEQLLTAKDGAITIIASAAVNSKSEDALRLFATYELAGGWLSEIKERIGAHLAILNEAGQIVSASFPLGDDLQKPLLNVDQNSLVDIENSPFGMRI
ncbi:hypothetical protein FDZ71_01030 [bacterium]|nr:MAG: hypothetical protein FDZ71_01030 [bacterium]